MAPAGALRMLAKWNVMVLANNFNAWSYLLPWSKQTIDLKTFPSSAPATHGLLWCLQGCRKRAQRWERKTDWPRLATSITCYFLLMLWDKLPRISSPLRGASCLTPASLLLFFPSVFSFLFIFIFLFFIFSPRRTDLWLFQHGLQPSRCVGLVWPIQAVCASSAFRAALLHSFKDCGVLYWWKLLDTYFFFFSYKLSGHLKKWTHFNLILHVQQSGELFSAPVVAVCNYYASFKKRKVTALYFMWITGDFSAQLVFRISNKKIRGQMDSNVDCKKHRGGRNICKDY